MFYQSLAYFKILLLNLIFNKYTLNIFNRKVKFVKVGTGYLNVTLCAQIMLDAKNTDACYLQILFTTRRGSLIIGGGWTYKKSSNIQKYITTGRIISTPY